MVYRNKLNGNGSGKVVNGKGRTIYPSQRTSSPPRRSLAADGAFVPTQQINDMGRPEEYKPEYVEQARHLFEHGYIEGEVADFFGVTKVTLQQWRHKYPEFAAAQVIGKKPADERVVRSCFMRAVGFTIKEEKIFCNGDGDVTRVTTDRYYPPEVSAIVWWTKNRIGWRDKVEHSGDPERPVTHSFADELKQRLDKLSVPTVANQMPMSKPVEDEPEEDAPKVH